jgi:V-type H+-transporting ATPase subunit A
MAKLLREDFLQQSSAPNSTDKFCPLYKTIWMLRNYITYYGHAQQTLASSSSTASSSEPQSEPDSNVNQAWGSIKQKSQPVLEKLAQMKFRVREPTKISQALC